MTSARSQPSSPTEAEKSRLQPEMEEMSRLKSVPKLLLPSENTPKNIGNIELEKAGGKGSAGRSGSESNRTNSLFSVRHESINASGEHQGRTKALGATSGMGSTRASVLDTVCREKLAKSVEGSTMRPTIRTIVTFTIVGGRAGRRGFANLHRKDKVSPGCHVVKPSVGRAWGAPLSKCVVLLYLV